MADVQVAFFRQLCHLKKCVIPAIIFRELSEISATALCAGPGHWGMNGILFLTAPLLPTFVASLGHCIRMLMVTCSVLCGTRIRKLFAIA